MESKTYKKNKVLYKQNSTPNYVYFLVKGECKLLKEVDNNEHK